MEGACGILKDEGNNIVRKVIKSKHRGTNAPTQYMLQEKAYNICMNNDFKIIFVPEVYEFDKKSYTMDRIDDSYPYNSEESSQNPEYVKELRIFMNEFIKIGYFPADFECYKQKDGTVAIVDFDKFVAIKENGELWYFGKKMTTERMLLGENFPTNFTLSEST